ncbi:MAG: xanthine dehydrogenase family protein molybdopterin-binding subunit, partial [Elusimicrobiaceae bacterium]|nr:xanthine dehydrogenase family protein molybdopterin-binding subunit [Elusimicrobiaceae bacterium]
MAKKKIAAEGLFCVGKSQGRKDALSKALGTARYTDDYSYGGMLYAATVRSPRPHIKIRGIRAGAAAEVKGFVTLVTAADIPGRRMWSLVINDYPFLPDRTARFAGEALALAVAETQEAAEAAAKLVEVYYEELPYLDDPVKGLEPDALKIYGDNNVFSSFVIKKGDADKALGKAAVVVERVFKTNYQVHVYLETQAMIAFPEAENGMTVYGSMQCPYYVLDGVSEALGIAHNKVRIVQRTTGGGFGGKEEVPTIVGVHAALCARKTGRPVKLVYNRVEDFQSMSKRHPGWVKIAYGADRNGRLVAARVKYVLDAGAYSTMSPVVLWRGTVHAAGPYSIPNADISTFAVATNKVPCGAYRGFGQPQVAFANESLMDELAEKLGMDPLELRLKNILRDGDTTATGQVIKNSGLEEVISAVRKKSGWEKNRRRAPAAGPKQYGIGLSVNYYGVGLGAMGRYLDRAGANVMVSKDGSVRIAVGNVEMGQGALTVLAQIGAETLNAPYCGVELTDVDTARVPDSGPTVASRTTLMSGNAIIDACNPIRARMFVVARELLEAKSGAVVNASGGIFSCGAKTVTFAAVASECWKRRLKMAEQGWYVPERTSFDLKTGRGDAYVTYSYAANVAEISADSETGEVRVERLICAHDMGKAVNPDLVIGQIHGGALQGIGYALYENLLHKDGVMWNPNMTDYVVPSAFEAPAYDATIVEKPYRAGPYNAKGFGELPLIGPSAAIANAIKHALGVRVPQTPLLPEKVWAALEAG